MKVITGFGFIKDENGRIVAKYDLPPGEHPLSPGYTFFELPNRAALDNIVVLPEPETPDQIREDKIANEMRQMAIERLKAKGEIA